MFKLASLVTFFLLGLSFASQVATSPETDEKHCKPHGCCGCDTSRTRAQIRQLTHNFVDTLSSPNGEDLIANYFTSSPKIKEIIELCTTPGCCMIEPNVGQFWSITEGARTELNIDSIEYNHCPWSVELDSVTVEGTLTVSFASPKFRSYALRVKITWVATEGCNWKIAEFYGLSDACHANDTSSCLTCGFSYP